jgi:riboflavin synthase
VFTGLVTELGTITSLARGESSALLTINAPGSVGDLVVGGSIAVNGVCLTATSISADSFTADVMVQTLALTSLSQVAAGSQVNLELAAKIVLRMGGHIVQGHVDGVATVLQLAPGEKWAQLDITVPEELMKYVVAQGSITLDGVSLTVGSLEDGSNLVTLWLIPETLAKTNLGGKKSGDVINVEVDILAKYVERLMAKGAIDGK